MKKIGLLLPAGNEDCLMAAVNNKVDVVYLGLPEFNACIFTSNFSRKGYTTAHFNKGVL
jgi:collagenase-like PrtC family protease